MSDLIKGMRYFHICAMGTCKNPGIHVTKSGECYCNKCVVRYVIKYGIDDFWPHGVNEVIKIYNNAIKVQESEQKERMMQNVWEREERDAHRPIRERSHRKK